MTAARCSVVVSMMMACSESDAPPCAAIEVGRELGDVEHVERLDGWRAMPTLRDGVYVHHSSREQAPFDAAISLFGNGNRDMNNFVCASADARKQAPDLVPHVYALPECPEDYVRGFVMARFEGEGVLTRLWLALGSLATIGAAGSEVVRIYVDDDPRRVFEFPLAGMLDGTADPVFAPPFGIGASRQVAWYYPVAFASKLVIAIDDLGPTELVYHQASAVLEPIGERDCDLAALRPAVLGPAPQGEVTTHAAPGAIALTGPGTIHELVVRTPDPTALLDVVMTATFDDQSTWSVALGDLFSMRLALPADDATTLLRAREVDGQTELTLALPMPFETSAELVFAAGPAFEVDLVVDPELPAAPWGHLEVHARRSVGPFAGRHPIVDVAGRGRLAGVCLTAQGHDGGALGLFTGPFNFLEGDPTIRIDGRDVVLGTGTEELFDGAFYFAEGPHANPFAQAWGRARDEASVPRTGSINACRWHPGTDAIDFATSLSMDVEVGPGMPALLDEYRSVAFVYRER
jgi:hypothetical protein